MDWVTGRATRQQFDRFAAEVTDALVRTAYLMTFDLAEAEDLVQETLVRVARHWNRARSMDHPVAYARRILANLVIDGSNDRSRRNTELILDAETDPEAWPDAGAMRSFGSVDTTSELVWALAALTRRQRAVIVLRYWEDMPEAEVAELLGCSAGTVKSTASRALVRLRELITEHERAPNTESPQAQGTRERTHP